MNSYDQAASAKWANLWLFLVVANLFFIGVGLKDIAREIRKAHIEVRVENKGVTP